MIETLLGSKVLYLCLYMSLGISAAGILYRVAQWLVMDVGPSAGIVPYGRRITAICRGCISAVFSRKIFKFFKVLPLDVLLQTRILKTDFLRWMMHILIFFGFISLLLMHALDDVITKKIFPEYFATLDPFQFLRNFFGVMIGVGVVIAIYRRVRYRGPMLVTRYADRFALILLAVIVVTGYLVESTKMVSERVYNRMAADFSPASGPGDEHALKAYWSREYGTVFSDMKFQVTPALLAKGKVLNEEGCVSCHAPAKSAFISARLSKAMKPVARSLSSLNADRILYYIHVMACFVGLAYLPFSKFFHIITNPLVIMINGMSDKKNVPRESAMPRRALELDACTGCGTCSRYCSVAPVFRMMNNREILPMDKLKTVRALASGKEMGAADLQKISEGAFICTSCYRCTEVCPSGINLQDQWLASKELLAEKGFPLPHVWVKKFNASEWSDRIRHYESSRKEVNTVKGRYYNLTSDSNVFAPCIQCQTCTNVCPVVAARTDLKDAVDITPQKIMNLLRLGLNDLAMGSRMVWDCTTCYQCQENCPQGIKVTEIIYELKNRAYEHFKKMDRSIDITEDPC
jgi:heterodisulfide reductase subunit C/nitrate reductase gamma subunit